MTSFAQNTFPLDYCPTLRADVRFTGGQRPGFVTLVDPRSSRHVELNSLESQIAQGLDGTRDLESIARQAAGSGVRVTRADIQTLVGRLAALGLLEPRMASASEVPAQLPYGTPPAALPSVGLDPSLFAPLEADDEGDDTIVDIDGSVAARAMEQLQVSGLRSGGLAFVEPAPRPQLAPPFRVPDASAPIQVIQSEPSQVTVTALGTPPPATHPNQPADPISSRPPQPQAPAPPPIARAETPSARWNTTGAPVEARAAARTRPTRRRNIALIIAGAVAALIVSLFLIPVGLQITQPCVLEPADALAVRTPIDGIVAEVLVEPGQSVAENSLLIRLDTRELSYKLEQGEVEIEQLRAKLEKLASSPAADSAETPTVKKAREGVAAAKSRLRAARRQLSRLKAPIDDGKPTPGFMEGPSKVDQTRARRRVAARRTKLATAEAELTQALEAAKGAMSAPSQERIDTELAMRRLEVERNYLTEQIEKHLIRAPSAGIIFDGAIAELLNKKLAAGEVVVELGDQTRIVAKTRIPARHSDRVEVGQPLTVRFGASTDLAGTVEAVSPDEDGAVMVIATFERQEALRSRTSGVVVIDVGETNVLGKLWSALVE